MAKEFSAIRYMSAIDLRIIASASSIISVVFLLLSFPVLAKDCEMTDIVAADNSTKAAKENFDELTSCIKDIRSRLTVVESRLNQVSEPDTRRVDGNRVLCTLHWEDPGAASVAKCNDDEEPVLGGCSMTCLDMMHLEAVPLVEPTQTGNITTPNAWSCRQSPQNSTYIELDRTSNPPRNFGAVAFCRKKLKPIK